MQRHSDLLLHLRDHGLQCVAVVWVTRQRFDMGDELAALRVFERRCHTHLHAELIGAVCLALSDAFDFRSVQAVDLVTPLSRLLLAYLARPPQLHGKDGLECAVPRDFSADITNKASKIGPKLPQ